MNCCIWNTKKGEWRHLMSIFASAVICIKGPVSQEHTPSDNRGRALWICEPPTKYDAINNCYKKHSFSLLYKIKMCIQPREVKTCESRHLIFISFINISIRTWWWEKWCRRVLILSFFCYWPLYHRYSRETRDLFHHFQFIIDHFLLVFFIKRNVMKSLRGTPAETACSRARDIYIFIQLITLFTPINN